MDYFVLEEVDSQISKVIGIFNDITIALKHFEERISEGFYNRGFYNNIILWNIPINQFLKNEWNSEDYILVRSAINFGYEGKIYKIN